MNLKFGTRTTVLAVVALGLLVVAGLGLALVRTSDSEKSAEPSEKPTAVGSWQRIAFDGTNYFVVWDDDDVYGTRISKSGSILDRPAIRISAARGSQADPQVAFDGRNFLVVWSDNRLRPGQENPEDDVFGARVTRAGVVLDRDGIPISTTEGQQFDPGVAFDGSRFLVVWTDFGSGAGDISGARMTTNGEVLDANSFVISSGEKEQLDPAVAFDGTNYLVAWSESSEGGYDIFGARVSRAGKALDPKAIRISTGGRAWEPPAVAFGDENYLVTWTDWETGYNPDILGTRVSPDGSVLDLQGLQIALSASEDGGQSVAFDGSNYLVVWSTGEDIKSARVSTEGAMLDSLGRAISTAPGDEPGFQGAHSIGFDGANYFVTWWAARPGDDFLDEKYDLFGVLLTSEGTTTDEPPITIAPIEPR